ncbi:small acid-soluble spore protein O [Natronobacillus azotifigens]|uniref:Small acid-soluble spore protein O n=1 Tax=Natronobacillus azotifigens TaxID=472978 RepID=A0A9J6R9V8_9BACI|nr:small acid-soluble spore protein O [Natronobacillus azotifigens]MCZ0702049.1 small acid-soluble spore protein O [Natronobacillus azotifigens]
MDKKKKKERQHSGISDEQAIRGTLPTEFDHEFANEPLTPNERHHNKKTKKRQ